MILEKTTDLTYNPKRIVSLVPSQTELLFTLGLNEETIGITRFCIHPPNWFNTKTKIGGTKTINIAGIHQLKPDLIIANKEENLKEQIEQLAAEYPIWLTDVSNFDDALLMIKDIGELTGKKQQAVDLIKQIQNSFELLPPIKKQVKTAYLIWQNPYMTVGGDTFIHDMLSRCGFDNIFGDKSRYPEIIIQDLLAANCRLLLLSSEPYPFKQVHINELEKKLPNTKIILVDGEMFSWYGSRILQSVSYFKQLITETEA